MHKIVSIGEVMMRLSPPGKQRLRQARGFEILYSGSEANVTAALALWGWNTCHVTCFPDNPLGMAARSALMQTGMDTRYVQLKGSRLGLYFVENGAMGRPSAITYDRLPSAFSEAGAGNYPWKEILQDARWFHWSGITPALSQDAADSLAEALEVCHANGITVSADINYRTGLWRYGKEPGDVMEPLVAKSHVVVASEHDTGRLFGIAPQSGEPTHASIARQLMQRFPTITDVIGSWRNPVSAEHNQLGGLLWNASGFYQSPTHELLHIVERIGSGDAFMAGFIHGRVKGMDGQALISFATAAAVLKHSIEGDVLSCTLSEVEELASGKTGGHIKR
jgi:2-dehydro-3-deoxygluconokinase